MVLVCAGSSDAPTAPRNHHPWARFACAAWAATCGRWPYGKRTTREKRMRGGHTGRPAYSMIMLTFSASVDVRRRRPHCPRLALLAAGQQRRPQGLRGPRIGVGRRGKEGQWAVNMRTASAPALFAAHRPCRAASAIELAVQKARHGMVNERLCAGLGGGGAVRGEGWWGRLNLALLTAQSTLACDATASSRSRCSSSRTSEATGPASWSTQESSWA